jgi:hypothetical protein
MWPISCSRDGTEDILDVGETRGKPGDRAEVLEMRAFSPAGAQYLESAARYQTSKSMW